MRYHEIKQSRLQPFRVTILLSEQAYTQTLIYADSPETAWHIASMQYGAINIISVDHFRTQKNGLSKRHSEDVRFWANRYLKYSKLGKAPPTRKSFNDQVKDHLRQQANRQLARIKAKKAKWQLQNLRNNQAKY